MNKWKTWQRLFVCMILAASIGMSEVSAANMLPISPDSYGAQEYKRITDDVIVEVSDVVQMTSYYAIGAVGLGNINHYILQPPESKHNTSRNSTEPGKKKVPSIVVTAPKEDQVLHTVKVTATGYTAGYESTGKKPGHKQYGITYSGVKVKRDKNKVSTIAADPKMFPLGSILYIPEYGYGIVADTGSAIKGAKIDLYFATTKQVYAEWGKKDVEVQVIKRGTGKCTEKMLEKLGDAIETYHFLPSSVLEEAI